MQLLEATLLKSPRQVNTKHGQRTVGDVQLPDGSEETLWRPENDPVLMGLRKGDHCQICRDSKGKISLIEPPGQPTTHRPLTKSQKRQVAEFITDVAAIQAFCWDQASEAMKDKGVNEAVIQAFASGLAISTMRRFGLDSRVEFAPEPGACNSAPHNTHSTVAPPTAQPGAQPRKRPGVTYSPPKMSPEKEALAQRVMSPAGASVWQGQGEDF